MNKQNVTVASHKEKSTLVRPKFGPGMLLQHEDLDLMTAYAQKLSRLMFSSLFGCGVICGLVVRTKSDCGRIDVIVEEGVGLDCSGYPIYVPKDQRFALDDKCDPNLHGPLWVVLCGTVTCCAPRTSLCASDDDEATAVCSRERDGFELRVVSERPKCICECTYYQELKELKDGVKLLLKSDCKCVNPDLPCYEAHYQGKCGCNCDECSDRECKCIVLARIDEKTEMDKKLEQAENQGDKNQADPANPWKVDHSVRRFIRPVLMRDPQVEYEEKKREDAKPKLDTGEDSAVRAKAELAKVRGEGR